MIAEQNYKEVYFHLYCKDCKHRNNKDTDIPCDECLDNPINVDTHRPVKWVKQDEKASKKKRAPK